MNPVALITFGSRIGPWLGRTIAADAKFLPTLLARLKTAGSFVGTNVGSLVTWAKANPGNAVLLSSTLASLGFSVAELFGDTQDPETKQFLTGLNAVAAKASALIDSVGARNEQAKFDTTTESRLVQDEVAIEVLSWARGFFGSVGAATTAHRMLQAFVEMPLDEVRHGFSVYRLR